MHTYRIKLADDGIGVERTVEFEGEDMPLPSMS